MQSLITKIATEKLSTYAGGFYLHLQTTSLDMLPVHVSATLYHFLLILLLDSSFQSVCRYYSSHCKCLCGLCCFYAHHFLRALLVGSLWVAFLFLDGDWYVCCQNDGSEQQAKLACIAEKDITVNENVFKAELKNTSRIEMLGEKKHSANKRFLYDKLIIIEEGNVLKEVLRNSAKEKLTEGIKSKIREKRREECFDVARELIEKDPREEELQPLGAQETET
ncbi:hypothetical protein F7725_001266 [Dissostichus mawsoni]|uniref:Uncharacterized protein n=1 Tax=Dissostichus mawsoni TaxID=36200 RepID=A0A7J5ZIU0_DISMA|nr:hypothetical protein F7725_001266 [Dissostichus mawsoni]